MTFARTVSRLTRFATACLLCGTMAAAASAENIPRQPYLGFDGEIVALPRDSFPQKEIRGMKVLSVRRGSPAARMGLERGDIVVNVDTWSFKSHDGFLAALRQAPSQKPSVLLINVRNGKMTRRSCSLPHQVDKRRHPDTLQLCIDLEEDMRGRP